MQPFGSYPVGLSIFLSDIDVSILGMGVDDDKHNQRRLSIECNTTVNTKKQKIKFAGAVLDLTDADPAVSGNSSEIVTSSASSKTSHSSSINKQQQTIITIDDSDGDEDAEEVISWSLDTFSTSKPSIDMTVVDSSLSRLNGTVTVPSVSTTTSLNAPKGPMTSEIAEVSHLTEQTQSTNTNTETSSSSSSTAAAAETVAEAAAVAAVAVAVATTSAAEEKKALKPDVVEHTALHNSNDAKVVALEGIVSSDILEVKVEGNVLQSVHAGIGGVCSEAAVDKENILEQKEVVVDYSIPSTNLSGAKRGRDSEKEDEEENEMNGSDNEQYLGEDAFDDFDGNDDYNEDEDEDDDNSNGCGSDSDDDGEDDEGFAIAEDEDQRDENIRNLKKSRSVKIEVAVKKLRSTG